MKKQLTCLALALSLVVALCPMASAATAGSDFDSAISVSMGKSYSNTLIDTDTQCYYKFTLSQSGTVKLSGTSYIKRTWFYLYDANQSQIASAYTSWNELAELASLEKEFVITSGTYYLGFRASQGTGKFNFKLSCTSAKESFKEGNGGSNNTFATANGVKLNKTYHGQIAINDDADCYRLKIKKKRKLQLKAKAYSGADYYSLRVHIDDPRGNSLASSYVRGTSSANTPYNTAIETTLKAGTYYFCVEKALGTGNYDFKICTNNKLKAPKHVKVKKKSSTSEKVSWKKVSKAKGYQIKLGTNKKVTKHVKKVTVKKSAKSKVVKNLTKHKKYYVKVRAYKKSNGQKSYGKWSKVKSVRL